MVGVTCLIYPQEAHAPRVGLGVYEKANFSGRFFPVGLTLLVHGIKAAIVNQYSHCVSQYSPSVSIVRFILIKLGTELIIQL